MTKFETWVPMCIRDCIHWLASPPNFFHEQEYGLLTFHLGNALSLFLAQILEQHLQEDLLTLCIVTHLRNDFCFRI